MKPIKPSQVSRKRAASIPPKVIQAFNELIAEKWDGSEARVLQDDAVDRIIKLMKPEGTRGVTKEALRTSIFDKGWLDVEDIFRAAGWEVDFDKPAYCETYDAVFTFSER